MRQHDFKMAFGESVLISLLYEINEESTGCSYILLLHNSILYIWFGKYITLNPSSFTEVACKNISKYPEIQTLQTFRTFPLKDNQESYACILTALRYLTRKVLCILKLGIAQRTE